MTEAEKQTFEQIITQYRQSLFKVVVTFESDPKLQQDLHQEILLAIWQALASFKGQSSVHTYIYRVAYNKALNHVAKQSRTPAYQDLDEAHICPQPGPESSLHTTTEINQLMIAIRQLPVTQRQLITLGLEGVSYLDIGEITGLSVSNVGVQINRAKKAMKEILQQTSIGARK